MRRWYGFLGMQCRVARQLPRIVTVSESSRNDIASQMGVAGDRLSIVPVGVDPLRFRPRPDVAKVPGRLMTTASADVPLKGLVPLLEALAKVRTERHAELVVIGSPRPESRVGETIDRLGLHDAVRFVSGVSDEELVRLYAEAEAAVVPSLYEGFSLPAVEAMACGVCLVATTGGALPEVVGRSGETGLLVPPGDPGALALALSRVLDEPELRARLGAAGRARVLERFTWRATAAGTAEIYAEMMEERAAACLPCATTGWDCGPAIASSTLVAGPAATPTSRCAGGRPSSLSTPATPSSKTSPAPWRPSSSRVRARVGEGWSTVTGCTCRSPTPPSTGSSPLRCSSTSPPTPAPSASWPASCVPAAPWPSPCPASVPSW